MAVFHCKIHLLSVYVFPTSLQADKPFPDLLSPDSCSVSSSWLLRPHIRRGRGEIYQEEKRDVCSSRDLPLLFSQSVAMDRGAASGRFIYKIWRILSSFAHSYVHKYVFSLWALIW